MGIEAVGVPQPAGREADVIKIGFICSEYPPSPHGGIGPVTRQIAEQLVAAGQGVVVVGLYDIDAPRIDDVNGVEVHRLPRSGSGLLADLRDRWRLGRYIGRLHAEGRIHVVEAPDWRGEAAFLPRSVPFVLRLHTSHTLLWRMLGRRPSRYVELLERMALWRARYIAAVSAEVLRQTTAIFRLRKDVYCEVIYNAVEMRDYPLSTARSSGRIVFAGSVKEVKGVHILIKAFARVAALSDATLDIYGQDTRAENGGSFLEECLRDLPESARRRVVCHGRVSREAVRDAFSIAAVVALPSRQEACPMAVLEAMATGAPVIFGACGPYRELIAHGQDGFHVEPQDADRLASLLLELLADDGLRAHVGLAARKKVEAKFSDAAMTRLNLDLYRRALAECR